MNCRDCERDLQAYIDGELAASERGELAMHLESCPACRGRERLLAGIRAAIPAAERAPSGLSRRVMERISRERPARHPWLDAVLGAKPLLGTAALAAIVILIALSGRIRRAPHEPAPIVPLERCLSANCTASRT